MSQLLITRTGPPAEVTELHPLPRPVPAAGQILVRMQAAAVNPADLNFIEGTYGTKPPLPCVPGMEGAGVVEAVGEGVSETHPDLMPGAAVLPLLSPGNWAQWRLLGPDQVFVLPAGIDPQQAALMRVNPPTALGMLAVAGRLPAGTWVAQNAASSAAGHCVIQIAKLLGLHTVNFVRRLESVEVCQALGADLTFTDDADGLTAAKAALAERNAGPIPLALNAVGGESALRLMDLLGPQGTHVTYGAMARQPLKVPNGMLIFKGLVLRGFWLTLWKETMSREGMNMIYQQLCQWILAGQLTQTIAAAYPIAEYQEALTHAAQSSRNGKVILTF